MYKHSFSFICRGSGYEELHFSYKDHELTLTIENGLANIAIILDSFDQKKAWEVLLKIKFCLAYSAKIHLQLSDYNEASLDARGEDYEDCEEYNEATFPSTIRGEKRENSEIGVGFFNYYKDIYDSIQADPYMAQVGIYLGIYYALDHHVEKSLMGFKIIELLFRKDYGTQKMTDTLIDQFASTYNFEDGVADLLKTYRTLRNALLGHGSFDSRVMTSFSNADSELVKINQNSSLLKRYYADLGNYSLDFNPIDERQNDLIIRHVIAQVFSLPFFRFRYPSCHMELPTNTILYNMRFSDERKSLQWYEDFLTR